MATTHSSPLRPPPPVALPLCPAPTCFKPAIWGERFLRFFWFAPVFTEHSGSPDQELPFLLLESWGHLWCGREMCTSEQLPGWVSTCFQCAPVRPEDHHAFLKLNILLGDGKLNQSCSLSSPCPGWGCGYSLHPQTAPPCRLQM